TMILPILPVWTKEQFVCSQSVTLPCVEAVRSSAPLGPAGKEAPGFALGCGTDFQSVRLGLQRTDWKSVLQPNACSSREVISQPFLNTLFSPLPWWERGETRNSRAQAARPARHALHPVRAFAMQRLLNQGVALSRQEANGWC